MNQSKLIAIRQQLKKVFFYKAHYEIVSKETRKIIDNRMIKTGWRLDRWNEYNEETSNAVYQLEKEYDEMKE